MNAAQRRLRGFHPFSAWRAIADTRRAAGRRAALRLSALAGAALVACGGGGDVSQPMSVDEDTADAAVSTVVADGRRHRLATAAEAAADARAAAPGFIPTGSPDAQTQGVFGPVLPLPLMPIHQVLLPDGRVLSYGSDVDGSQGGGLHYAVWDPALGTGADAYTVLPTVTGTNIFCAGQSLLPDTGDVLIIGGTTMIDKVNGWGVNDVNLFTTSANTLAGQSAMSYRRWYPTLLTLTSGDQLALGGRMDRPLGNDGDSATRAAPTAATVASSPATYASMPELWNRTTGWHPLTAADNDDAFGSISQAWYYPRAWVMPAGDVFVMTTKGSLYKLATAGAGTLSKFKQTAPKALDARLQAVMYAPGKIMSVRSRASTITVDINAKNPVVAQTSPTARLRYYGNATLLADGQVWFNGGSSAGNVLDGDHFVSEKWDPATGQWSDMATATIPRLYHSSSVLLPDATVLTGGGGDPGPVTNLNAEIYYPPYLYLKDGTGTPAPRPTITSAPDVLGWGQSFSVTVASNSPISRVTLIRSGVVTHNFNENQRFQDLAFTNNAGTLTLKTPAKPGIAPPGYYLLFVFDGNGVPSVAKIFRIGN
jgi:hypothetical protein